MKLGIHTQLGHIMNERAPFLQAKLEEEVCLEPAPECLLTKPHEVWRLRNAMPGLRGSPLAFTGHVDG